MLYRFELIIIIHKMHKLVYDISNMILSSLRKCNLNETMKILVKMCFCGTVILNSKGDVNWPKPVTLPG